MQKGVLRCSKFRTIPWRGAPLNRWRSEGGNAVELRLVRGRPTPDGKQMRAGGTSLF